MIRFAGSRLKNSAPVGVEDTAATVVVIVGVRRGDEERLTQALTGQGYELQAFETDPKKSPLALREFRSAADQRPAVVDQLLAALANTTEASSIAKTDKLAFDELSIDRGRFEVRVRDSLVPLTKTEFNLLWFLASEPNIVFTRKQIVSRCKGTESLVNYRSVDVNVVGLRRKLGAAGHHVQTVRGVGYRFVENGN